MKHLLDTRELTREEAIEILDVADYMAQVKAENRTLNVLNGKTVVNFFFEDSTRTRLSFEAAEKRLGATVTNFSASGSSLSKGESLKDTAQTLKAIAADAFVIRHSASGAPQRLAEAGWTDIPVLNAGDGTHAHPTQALLDAVSLRQYKAERDGLDSPRGTDLSGMRVLIVGDILHSRVARSNLWLLTTLGAQVVFVAPPTLLPLNIASWVEEAGVEIFHDFDEAIATNPDAVMRCASGACEVPLQESGRRSAIAARCSGENTSPYAAVTAAARSISSMSEAAAAQTSPASRKRRR